MTFKNFNVDFDKLTIDDTVILKPSYLSASQWYDFWNFALEADGNFDKLLDDKYKEGYQEGLEDSEDEHEKELEDQQRAFERNISSSIRKFQIQADFHGIKNKEFLLLVEDIFLEAIPIT